MNLFGLKWGSGDGRVRAISPDWIPAGTLHGIFAWRGKNMYCPKRSATGGMMVYRVPLAGPLRKVTGVFERNRSPMGRQVHQVQRTGTGGPDGARRVLPMHHCSGTHFFGGLYFAVAPGNPDVPLAEGNGNARMVKLDR